jgi:hypothetical protein
MSILAFEQQLALLHPFCQTVCIKGKSKNKHELIELRSSKGDASHGICCSFASHDETRMPLFAPTDATDCCSFIVVSVINLQKTINKPLAGNVCDTTTCDHPQLQRQLQSWMRVGLHDEHCLI